MSGVITATTVGAIALGVGATGAVAGAVVGGINSSKAAAAQNKQAQIAQYSAQQQDVASKQSLALQKTAADQATKNADATAAQAQTAIMKANAASPNVSAIIAATQQGNAGGGGGTMLTGPGGVNPNSLTLGKNTLLGS